MLVMPLLLLLAACPQPEAFTGYWTDDAIYMQRLKDRLEEAGIPYTVDKAGQVSWSVNDSKSVETITTNLDREMHGGLAVRFGSNEANRYFRKLLEERDLEYLTEQRADGEWTRWYPDYERQMEELRQLVMAFESDKALATANAKCEQVPSRGQPDEKVQAAIQGFLPPTDC
jgi:hypothetical protein